MLPDILALLESSFARHWITNKEIQEETIIITLKKDYIARFLSFIKEEKRFLFNQLTDIYAVDLQKTKKRFQISYNLLSINLKTRIKINIYFGENESIPSISEVFPNACWYEREIWDMFGIVFAHNPNLCRLINDSGFVWFPLRKDFPLKGFVSLKYSPKEEVFLYQTTKEDGGKHG